MTDNGSQDELTLRRMPDGGFLVFVDSPEFRHGGRFRFAATSIDDALSYMKRQIMPVASHAETAE